MALACLVWAGGAVALAANGAEARRIALLRFHGRHAEIVRAFTTDVLDDVPSLEVLPVRTLEAERGLPEDAKARAAELARRLALTALLRGHVTRVGRGLRVKLSVVDGKDGEVLGDVTIVASSSLGLHKKMRAELWRKIRPLVRRATAPAVAGACEPSARGGCVEAAKAPTKAPAKAPAKGPPKAPAKGPPKAPAKGPPKVPAQAPAKGPDQSQAQAQVGPHDDTEHDEAKAAPPPPPPAPPPPPRPPSGAPAGNCRHVEIDVAGGAIFRVFDYRNEHEGALRGYYMLGDPIARGDVTVYAFSGGPCTFISGLGIRVGGEWAHSRPARLEGQTFATTAFAYHVELVLAIPSGRFTFKPSVGYFDRTYRVDRDPFPSIDARAVGAGLDVEARFGTVFAGVAAGGRLISSTGPLGSTKWFPGATASGLVGEARLGVALNDWLALFAAGAIELDFYDLHPTAGRAYQNGIADAALDRYTHVFTGLRLRF